MKTFYVYRLLSEKDEVLDEVVVDDPSDDICIGGYGNDHNYHQYDSYEAYHAYEHFKELNVGLRIVCAKTELDTSKLNFD